MKKLLTVSAIAALGLSTSVLAGGLPEEMPIAPAAVGFSDTGVYLGLEGGFGMTNWNKYTTPTTSTSKDNGIVGRVFAGYDIHKYFAAEVGYSYFFNKPKIEGPLGDQDTQNYAKVKTQAIDLFGKIKAPFTDEITLYGKVGVNYLLSKTDVTGTLAPFENRTLKAFNVAYGVGADYYITPNVAANIEWLRYNGNIKNDSSYQPYSDSFMIGLRYKFEL